MCAYKQFSMYDRKIIEEGLNDGLSFRMIAQMINRSASSISREIKANRAPIKTKARMGNCVKRDICKICSLCTRCSRNAGFCQYCTEHDCRNLCDTYIAHTACPTLSKGRLTCNGCKRHWGCNRPLRFEYKAAVANESSKQRRSESRQGVDMGQDEFEDILDVVRPALARGLSPYEIAASYAGKVTVSPSTLYRWIERGYGGMANIELERKVGFAPRKKTGKRTITHHGPNRSYEAFLRLGEMEYARATEMDTVVGRKHDKKCILTLYSRTSHFQLYLLLDEKTPDSVVAAFDDLERIIGLELFRSLFGLCLTDNGTEFEDTLHLEASCVSLEQKRCQVFYCDPRQSQQKPGCEKHHSELRQIIPKQSVHFDALCKRDVSIACSHVNSTPRKSLCGMSAIQMLRAAYGKNIDILFDAYGIEEILPDDLTLKSSILNSERAKRGERPLVF